MIMAMVIEEEFITPQITLIITTSSKQRKNKTS